MQQSNLAPKAPHGTHRCQWQFDQIAGGDEVATGTARKKLRVKRSPPTSHKTIGNGGGLLYWASSGYGHLAELQHSQGGPPIYASSRYHPRGLQRSSWQIYV